MFYKPSCGGRTLNISFLQNQTGGVTRWSNALQFPACLWLHRKCIGCYLQYTNFYSFNVFHAISTINMLNRNLLVEVSYEKYYFVTKNLVCQTTSCKIFHVKSWWMISFFFLIHHQMPVLCWLTQISFKQCMISIFVFASQGIATNCWCEFSLAILCTLKHTNSDLLY